ncbi:MAG: type II toxin-antitoxin system RelE/ParE family toxin [Flexilinea sp.]|nr:type II toxin-antitoxin system RelE/ParE family toxin [Flexilinea sp.]
MKIVYTNTAHQDLRAIYDYIALSLLSPDAARNISEKIMKTVRSLEFLPERNPLYREEPWHSQGVRFIPVQKYLVFYTINTVNNTVSVVRIMYGARDLSRQLEETTEWE